MSRATSLHLTTIRCDREGCPSEPFVTASIQRLSRKQAGAAGWHRLPAWTVTKEDSPRRLYDLCLTCGPVALLIRQNRPEVVKAERAARKVAHVEARAAKAQARLEKRAAKAAAKIVRAEAAKVRAVKAAAKVAAKMARAAAVESRPCDPRSDAVSAVILEACADEIAEPRHPDDVLAAMITSALDPANRTPVAREDLGAYFEGIDKNLPLRNPRKRPGPTVLDVIADLLRVRGELSVVEIVEQAAGTLPTQSRTPRTIVARDLAIDIKIHGETSRFVRTAPGRFALRGSRPDNEHEQHLERACLCNETPCLCHCHSLEAPHG